MPDPGTFLVTGASSGIGRAVTEALLASGARVTALCGRPVDRVGGFREAPDLHLEQCDLGDFDAVDARLPVLLRERPPDSCVLCHGFGDFGAIEQFSRARIEKLVAVNLTSYMVIARHLLPVMKAAGQGDVVIVGSEAAHTPGRNGAVYSATKHGLRGLAGALRDECSGAGVRVSLVNPGMVDTPFFEPLDFAPGEDPANSLSAADVASAIVMVLNMPPNAVVDEINMAPLKKVVRRKTAAADPHRDS